jgi:peptidoglycan/xylan/chitin deacetylase (PgdA/CDA1 family)/GT2 family glycosyltransferase
MNELSVVIATRNRAGALRRCLDALADQTLPPASYEVVVVVDGSTDGAPELLARYTVQFDLRIEQQGHRGPAAARNRAVSAAAGEYCLFLEDDVVAEPRLLEEHLRAQREGGGVLALGALRLRMLARGSRLARQLEIWSAERNRRLDEDDDGPGFRACEGANFSAPTAAIRAIGGFDEDLPMGDEVELAYRLERTGLRVAYLPLARAEKRCSKGFREMVRDLDHVGAAAVERWRRHPELLRHPPLGDFSDAWTGHLLLRRLLLATRAPVWPLAVIDRVPARRPPASLYRFLRSYCFWRAVRRTLDDRDMWQRLTRGTVILMYHAIGEPGEGPSRFVMPAGRFRRQLAWLRLRRHPVLTLDEYVDYRERNRLPPARSVAITFDDGYVDNAELALPMLRRRDMPATFFVVTGAAGKVNWWDEGGELLGRRLLSSAGVRALHEAGMTIGAHTVSHPQLTELDSDAAEREIVESRAQLARELGSPVRHFAYPHGKSSPELVQRVRRAGFATACGVKPGANGVAVPTHDLRRMEVRGTRSLPRFAIDLWLGRPLASSNARRAKP